MGGAQAMIALDEFEYPAKDCFRVMFWAQFMNFLWHWSYLTVVMCAAAIIFDDWMIFGTLSVLVAMAFLLTAYCTGRHYAYSKANSIHFQKREMTFETGKYHVVCEDGTESHGPLSHFHKADIFCGHYRLFMSSVMFYPIPVSVFRSDEERLCFETEILGDKLKMQAMPWKRIFVFLLVSALLLGLAFVLRPHMCCVQCLM